MLASSANENPPALHKPPIQQRRTTMPESTNKTDVANGKELTLVRVARAGNIEAVKSILEAASPSRTNPDDDLDVASCDPHVILPSVINESGVWQDIVERDYENVYSWYGDTPLIAAARNGHVDVVKLLLSTGYCDPTLQSCPADDVYETALSAVEKKLEQVARIYQCQGRTQRSCCATAHIKSGSDPVAALASKHKQELECLLLRYKKIVAVVSASLQFWEKAPYSGPMARSRTSFTNRMRDPTESNGLGDDDDGFSKEKYDKLIVAHAEALSSALDGVEGTGSADICASMAISSDPAAEVTSEAFVGAA